MSKKCFTEKLGLIDLGYLDVKLVVTLMELFLHHFKKQYYTLNVWF